MFIRYRYSFFNFKYRELDHIEEAGEAGMKWASRWEAGSVPPPYCVDAARSGLGDLLLMGDG
jgi:hypothetical protein